jgi:peptide subunit release factor 1 (eRF1)
VGKRRVEFKEAQTIIPYKMYNQADLRKLAELSGPERAFLSVYLNDAGADGYFKSQCQRIRALLRDHPDELEHFEKNLEWIARDREENAKSSDGRCWFACWALDFYSASALPPEFRISNTVRVGSSPYLRPLAEFHDEFENFVAVIADNKSAQVFSVTMARKDDYASIKGDIKNHVRVGGWSQKRYQRRRDNELMHYAKEICGELIRLEQELSFRRLVLIGSSETLEEISRQLPPSLAEKLADIEAVDLGRSDEEVWQEVYKMHFAEERQSEQELWERVRNECLGGSRGVAGIEEVYAAALAGRIDVAIARRDVKLTGSQCRSCENISPAQIAKCNVCQSSDLFPVDMMNKLSASIYSTSARIDFSDAIQELDDLGGVAALLRY